MLLKPPSQCSSQPRSNSPADQSVQRASNPKPTIARVTRRKIIASSTAIRKDLQREPSSYGIASSHNPPEEVKRNSDLATSEDEYELNNSRRFSLSYKKLSAN